MQLKIRLKFSDEERQVLTNLCRQLDLSTEMFCKQAVILAVNNVYAKAEKLQSLELAKRAVSQPGDFDKLTIIGDLDVNGNTGTDSQKTPVGTGLASNVLARSEADAINSRASTATS